jgi:hypothetical protein
MKNIIEKQKSGTHILLGDIAPLVSVELKTKAVNINFKKETEDIRILKYRPNLLVLQENRELNRLSRKMPQYFQNIELLKSYKIFNNYRNNDATYFYRIDNDFIKNKLLAKNNSLDN